MYYTDSSEIDSLVDYIKSFGDIKILYGGWKSPYFLADDNIDYYVLGHADNSVVQITNDLNQKKLPSSKVVLVEEKQRNVIDSADFDEPSLDKINTSWETRNVLPKEGLPIELARGCIFKCKFCNYSLLGKQKGTYIRPSSMIKEEMIKNWELFGTENYYITDDTFNDDNDKIEELHRIFTSLPFKPKFSSYLRIDLINKYPHQADLLTDMGLVGTYFGLETFNYESAKCIGKGLHPNKVKDRLEWLSDRWKNKVNIASGFILGLPYDTHEYFDELIKWCEETNTIQNINFYPLFLFKRDKTHPLKTYASEFSLNSEIYGYSFPDDTNKMNWVLSEQNLNYVECQQIANDFSNHINYKNKISEFQMITNMNIGIPLQDMYDLTINQINQKYDIVKMNKSKLDQYKNLIGLEL